MTKSKYGRPPERLVPCMPPLLDEETKPLSREDGQTKFGGTACELLVKAYFLAQNINIAEPHVDDGVDCNVTVDVILIQLSMSMFLLLSMLFEVRFALQIER